MLSSVGLNFLIGDLYLLPLTIVSLLVAVGVLAYKARERRGFAPLFLGVVGAGAIVSGKFYWDNQFVGYAGVTLLVAVSVWNSWPQRGNKLVKEILPKSCGEINSKSKG